METVFIVTAVDGVPTDIYWVEARDGGKHPATQRVAPMMRNHLAPDLNSAETETSSSKLRCFKDSCT